MLSDFLRQAYRLWSEQKGSKPKFLKSSVVAKLEARCQEDDHIRAGFVPIGELCDNSNNRFSFLLLPAEIGHCLTMGKTGSGKTMWAVSYARSLARAGWSIVAVSPHTDLSAGIIDVARGQGLPTVHIDFSGRGETVTPWSFLHADGVRPDEAAHLASSLFASALGTGTVAGHIQTTLNPLFLLLSSCPDLNLLDAERLIKDPDFSKRHVRRLQDPLPAVSSFFATLQSKGRQGAIQRAQFALNRIDALLNFRGVRLTLCGQPRIDLRRVLRSPCAIVLSIPAAQLGEHASLLGGLFIEHLRLLLYQRAMDSREPKVMLFVDELGSMIQGNAARLAAVLSESRKFRFFLTGMGQHLSQVDGPLFDSFMANANIFVLGRLSPRDAARFAELPTIQGLPSRPTHEGLWVDGRAMHWVDGNTVADDEQERGHLKSALIEAPPRIFHVHLPIDGIPQTLRMRSLDYTLAREAGRDDRFLGQQPVETIEAQLRQRLWPASTETPLVVRVSQPAASTNTAPPDPEPQVPTPTPEKPVVVVKKPTPMTRI